MKKLLFAMVVSALLVFAIATTVSADNGPHGGFNGSTDACASCHRAHSAVSSDGFLLVASDVYSLSRHATTEAAPTPTLLTAITTPA